MPIWLMLAGLLVLAPAAVAAPTGEELAKLKAGETVVRPFSIEGMSGIEALFWVDAPPETAFRVLSDSMRLAEFMPNLIECTVLEEGDRYVVVRMLGAQGEMVQRRRYDPPHRVHWRLVRASGLKDVKGRWLIEPSGKGSLLSYGVAVQAAFPVPQGLVDAVQSRNLPPLVRNVRARIESGGKWVKPDFKRN